MDVRAPIDGRRAWLTTRGEGVRRTADVGATRTSLGLRRVQLRDLERRQLVVGSSDLIFDRGAFVRPLPE